MNEEVVQAAMNIILNAGDARNFCKQALDSIAKQDFDEAKEKIISGDVKVPETPEEN